MSDFYRWQVLTGMRLLIWESSVSPMSLAARRSALLALIVGVPAAVVSAPLAMFGGLVVFSLAYVALRKQSFAEELKTRLLLYVPNDADSYYRLLASIAVGQCSQEMLSKWIQLESTTLQRGVAGL